MEADSKKVTPTLLHASVSNTSPKSLLFIEGIVEVEGKVNVVSG